MVVVAIYIVLALIGIGLLAMVAFGVRSVAYGKINVVSMGIVVVPLMLLLVLGLVMPSWAEAGIWTIVATLISALVALLVTGIKGLFS